ncbi:hypothetical protein AB6A40_007251 [Gnathostoma spinigerum]|uniref:Succinate dehydrogenase cytochrome b560 subunit, mitochondrial n=1 Tax=Gnathostoma spinigerum TaxID=75299 RepID=A0ABD6EVE0_9BILA
MSLLPYKASTAICRALRQNVRLVKMMQTTAPRSSTKTPVQVWGWDYLMRQRALKRPISPHLSVFKPELPMLLSGLHRITGCAMAGTLLIGAVGFSLVPFDFTTFVEFLRGLGLPSFVWDAVKFVIAFPLVYHTLNGIRFIGFDMAKGTDIVSVYRSGYFVFTLAAIIAISVALYPRYEEKQHHAVKA